MNINPRIKNVIQIFKEESCYINIKQITLKYVLLLKKLTPLECMQGGAKVSFQLYV